jgi:hypothetical protein
MKVFTCQACSKLVYFENVKCENCGHALGYIAALNEISAIEPLEDGSFKALAEPESPYRFCNNAQYGVCNWLVPADDPTGFCVACRHNRTIPDLSHPGNDVLWGKLERAKHRLFYTLLRLRLPLHNRVDDPDHGLAFDFLQDPPVAHAVGVMTGHDNGLITLALKEADDAVRERVRAEMGEPYRTLLGHFRHEIGHHYWDELIETDPAVLEQFRDLFGDDRADYAAALQRHYAEGAPPNWQENFVSAYASSHPWEDFAETWAHYLHIVDTLETAYAFGMSVDPEVAHGEHAAEADFDPLGAKGMQRIIDRWLPISFAMNSLNRSMGYPDLYPFVLTPAVIAKLAFVHRLTHSTTRNSTAMAPVAESAFS